jgi:hypothetical protein
MKLTLKSLQGNTLGGSSARAGLRGIREKIVSDFFISCHFNYLQGFFCRGERKALQARALASSQRSDTPIPYRVFCRGTPEPESRQAHTRYWLWGTRWRRSPKGFDAGMLLVRNLGERQNPQVQKRYLGHPAYSLNNSRRRLVCARQTGIPVCFLSFILSM